MASPHQPSTRPSAEAIAAVSDAIELSGPASAALYDGEAAALFEDRFAALSGEAAELASLVASIEAHGVQTPIHVRPLPGGDWEITSGHRRVAAARLAGLGAVPALIQEHVPTSEVALSVWQGNHLRADFTAWERAVCAASVRDDVHRNARGEGKTVPSLRELARLLSIPASTLCELLKVADRLLPVTRPDDVGRLQQLPASRLLRLADDPALLREPASSPLPKKATSRTDRSRRKAEACEIAPWRGRWVSLDTPVSSLSAAQATELASELAALHRSVEEHLQRLVTREHR